MGRITSYSKQIVVFFLALSLLTRPAFASSVGGWSMGNPIAQGASTIYEGSKNVIINGADYVKKGTATITPTAANVAKTLGKGAAGLAVSVVVDQLLDGVDWVLDPENNQIKYWQVPEGSYVWKHENRDYYSPSEACNGALSFYNSKYPGNQIKLNGQTMLNNGEVVRCEIYFNDNYWATPIPRTLINTEKEEKTISLPAVAQQVITNAESETDSEKKVAAQAITTAAAADMVAEAETDNVKARPIAQQLEASSTTKPADEAAAAQANTATGTQTQNPTKPETTDLALEFPAFCGWAPTVCEFAQTAIQSIADAKAEYADKPQENTDTELEIPDLEDQSIDSDISFGGSCPAPLTSQVNFMGLNKTIEFSFDPVCEIAEFIKPVVISISAFSAALIVAGIRTEDD